ncbi:MAG: hypothetical protein LC799_11290, partial [Actinobacteria bacterium]|nr:hypothetical protein [Actinomycetota bacterium]
MLIGYRGVIVHDRLALYWKLKKARHGLCAPSDPPRLTWGLGVRPLRRLRNTRRAGRWDSDRVLTSTGIAVLVAVVAATAVGAALGRAEAHRRFGDSRSARWQSEGRQSHGNHEGPAGEAGSSRGQGDPV